MLFFTSLSFSIPLFSTFVYEVKKMHTMKENDEVVIEILKKVQRAKHASGIIKKGHETEVARRIVSREHEIERLESYIRWLKSEKRSIKMLSERPISPRGQHILSEKIDEKDNKIKKAKERLDELVRQKESEGLAGIKIMAGLVDV